MYIFHRLLCGKHWSSPLYYANRGLFPTRYCPSHYPYKHVLIVIQDKLAYVDVIMELLELQDIEDALIGNPGAGLGVEQRKRVTIGVELVSKPYVPHFQGESLCLEGSPTAHCFSSTSQLPVLTAKALISSSPFSASSQLLVKLYCAPSISLPPLCLGASISFFSSNQAARWFTVCFCILSSCILPDPLQSVPWTIYPTISPSKAWIYRET